MRKNSAEQSLKDFCKYFCDEKDCCNTKIGCTTMNNIKVALDENKILKAQLSKYKSNQLTLGEMNLIRDIIDVYKLVCANKSSGTNNTYTKRTAKQLNRINDKLYNQSIMVCCNEESN